MMQSCNNTKPSDLKSLNTGFYLKEMAFVYWDFFYKFPTSYSQSRDTDAWFFPCFTHMDSILLSYDSEITYTNQDTALLITYKNDTLWHVLLPCSCDWTDEIPLGPRAYDSLNRMILDDIVILDHDEFGYVNKQIHLDNDLKTDLWPAIEKRMNKKGYVPVDDKEIKKYPQYLLVEYLSESDSIQLIKACAKYSNYFYEEYAVILRNVFSEYCKANHVSRLLTPVFIFLPVTND